MTTRHASSKNVILAALENATAAGLSYKFAVFPNNLFCLLDGSRCYPFQDVATTTISDPQSRFQLHLIHTLDKKYKGVALEETFEKEVYHET